MCLAHLRSLYMLVSAFQGEPCIASPEHRMAARSTRADSQMLPYGKCVLTINMQCSQATNTMQ